MKPSPFTTRTIVVLTLTFACLSALLITFHFRQARLSASALPGLQGAAAVEHLKQRGLYSSLSEAMTAARYGVKPVPSGNEFVANNPAHQLRANFVADGLELRATAQTWRLGMKLSSAGYGNRQVQIGSGALAADGNRVEYTRRLGSRKSEIKEWYVNTPTGLEQGFTLAEPPGERRADEPLRLALALESELKAQTVADGQAVEFWDAAGNRVLRYDKLAVWDARGQQPPARMSVKGKELWLEVEDAAAVYPVTIDPNFTQQAYLKASNTGVGDSFGASVAVSGDTVVVGARGEASNATGVNGNQADNSASSSGAVYVFVRSGTTWSQQAYLKASNTEASDNFGISVAVSDDTLVVGAAQEDSNATGANGNQADNSAATSGAAYVFVRSGVTWSQQAYLKASNTEANDNFGISVAVSGNTVVVGAFGEDSNATGVNGNQANNTATVSGAAYVFVRSGVTWSQQAYLKASNTEANDNFGISVAVSDDTVVVAAIDEDSNATGVNGNQADNTAGNSGAVYVFVRSGMTWSQQAYLKASNTEAGDSFGRSVAMAGDTVVVGAPFKSSGAVGSGASYVFVRSGMMWSQQAYLTVSNTGVADRFGFSVAVSSETLVVGANQEDSNATGVNGDQTDNSVFDSGAAYVFVRSGVTWSQQAYLKASNTGAGDRFGSQVAVSGDTVVVGADSEDSNATGVNGDQANNGASASGAVYILFTPPIVVTTLADEQNTNGQCSLREAIINANADDQSGSTDCAAGSFADTITFSVTGTINLTGALPDIAQSLTITGPGASQLTVRRDTGGNYSIFTVNNSILVTINDLTISNGNSGSGGGIRNFGTLTVNGCAIVGNTATFNGGGVESKGGTLVINNSTISGNTANASSFGGSGIFIFTGSATLTNCTISGNMGGPSGSVTNYTDNGNSSLMLTNCTIANNLNSNGGISNYNNGPANGSAVTTQLRNTIVANNNGLNFLVGNPEPGNTSTITSLGNNLSSDASLTPVAGDIFNTDARLGPLANNGGPILTHGLRVDSPAIDAGTSTGIPATDGRGLGRVIDGNGDNINAVDIGALEVQKIVVTTTADSGAGSLRQAILDNNTFGSGLIAFNIAGGGVQTIAPTSALPAITRMVTINGYTQPGSSTNTLAVGNDAVLLIELNGTSAGATNGLDLNTGYCDIRGLVINRFNGNGIRLFYSATAIENHITGNFIGTNPAGTTAQANTGSGIFIESNNNTIGGPSPAARNILSGNGTNGISIFNISSFGASGNQIRGNYIGLNAAGTGAVANGQNGIDTNGASNNIFGGTAAGERNVFSGNTLSGIVIFNNSNNNQVIGNYVGTSADGLTAVPNTNRGITIRDAANNVIGGLAAGAGNLVSGNSVAGISIQGATTTNTQVLGNVVGTNPAGTAPIPNVGPGVTVFSSATGVTVGGPTPETRNLISGNTGNGVELAANNCLVQGNFIGTDINGTAALGNGNIGVFISGGASNTVGGSSAGARNLISANGGGGVRLSNTALNNTVLGNFIGTDVTGTAALGNQGGLNGGAVRVEVGSTGNIIGGTTGTTPGGACTGACNLISGNATNGINVEGPAAGTTQILGNYIGVNAAGTAALTNAFSGVVLRSTANNIVGGNTPAARNVISGNTRIGVNIFEVGATNNTVQGNFIGTDAAGTAGIPNAEAGVQLNTVSGAGNNLIGGTAAGEGNLIAFNGSDGVLITTAANTGNRLLGNNIFANGGIGIDLADNNVTANDAGDSDAGPNNLQNFPVLNFVTSGGTLGGMLDSLPANTAYPVRIEFFANTTCDGSGNGEGEVFLGFFSMPAQGFFSFSFTPIPGKPFITATATDANGNTSEFSACRMVGDAPITVNTTADTVAADGFCSLREAIQAANTNAAVNECAPGVAGLDNIIFALGTGTPSIAITGSALPAITEPVNINGATGGATRVELNGAGAGVAANGLTINAGSSLITSLVINRFTASGIVLQTAGGNSVQGCLIGTDSTGATALANGLYGVAISNVANNTIGGVTPGAGNVLSGNTQLGLFITGSSATGNVVQGNFIGTNAAGTADLGNGLSGIQIDSGASNNTIGGTTTAARNVISGNDQLGIFMTGANTLNNVIQGNYVGTNAAGTDAIGNSLGGIQTSPNTLVGGTTPGAGNLISGNLGSSNYGLSTESNTTVQGNIIGLNAVGTVAIPNTGGLGIGGSNNIIGGTTTAERNVISGNSVNGIVAFPGSGHQISGNYVGVNVAGTVAILNAGEAILLDADMVQIGGMASGAGNLIAGRVRLGTNGNTVQGNFIGMDGTISFGANAGILVFGANNLIGGTTSGARNVISGITGQGIRFQGTSAINNLVQGNFIGTNAAGTAALGNSDSGIDFVLGASNNTIGGTDPAARNIISSNGTGITIANATTTGNQVLGNYIGTDVSGTVDLGNQQHGVHIGSPANIIGGTAAGAGNVISGNGSFGIFLSGGGAMNNQVLGNFIGTDAAGTAEMPNSSGVSLQNSATLNTIGGTVTGARNVISGNNVAGVLITGVAVTGNLVQGNFIGTNPAGTLALGNGTGVRIDTASGNTIGGTAAGTRNIISGNTTGVDLRNGTAPGNAVLGNFIGTTPDGTAALGNTVNGVSIISGASNNTIGGTAVGAGNVISGNGRHGVEVNGVGTTGNQVMGNLIGTNPAGTAALANANSGVFFVNGATGNTLGGMAAGEGNVIAFNVNNGVRVADDNTTGNRVSGNRIASNGLLGIDLAADGVTGNDTGDGDTGPNNRQNFPVLTTITTSGGMSNFSGTLNSTPNMVFRIEFFANASCDASGNGEGQFFIGSTDVTTDGSGNATISATFPSLPTLNAGGVVTATATDAAGNTSEFSPCQCNFAIDPTEAGIAAQGSVGNTVSIIAPNGCSWTAVSNSPFITVTGGASGSGNGTVTYNVTLNPGTQPRTGSLTIAGYTFYATQAASGTVLNEGFNGGLPPDWDVMDGGAVAGDGMTWVTASTVPCPQTPNPGPPFVPPFQIVDFSCVPPEMIPDESLITPPFDARGLDQIMLQFDSFFRFQPGDLTVRGDVDISLDRELTWINVLPLTATEVANTRTINLTPFIPPNSADVRVRFRFYATGPRPAGPRAPRAQELSWGIDRPTILALTVAAVGNFIFPPGGDTQLVNVAAPFGYGWQPTTDVPWITIVDGGKRPSGTGTGTFTAAASAYGGICPRTGTVTVTIPNPAGGPPLLSVSRMVRQTGSRLSILPTSPDLPDGILGQPYSQTFTQTGSVGTISWSVISGTLPAGLTLNSTTGVLSGTPTMVTTPNPATFTIQAIDAAANNCEGTHLYNLRINCPTITVNPATVPNGTVGTAYNQTLTASGGTGPYSFTVSAGALPGGLNLSSSGTLTGLPGVAGSFTFTIRATDSSASACTGDRQYTITVGSGNGLQFYPLPSPVRLLDTRASATVGCVKNTGPFVNNETRTQAARTACSTIPANATAIIGNITVVPSGPGFLTLFPSDATQPTVANSNFKAGEVTNNFFTVGLGATGPDAGAFKIFTSLFNGGTNSEVIIDVTGYYAPPGTGGLYYHPLPAPVRLLQTFPGQTGCFLNGSQQLIGTNDANANPALDLTVDGRGAGLPSPCNGIPSDAVVLVGNATTVFPNAPFGFGYLTIYPSDATRPTVASSNYGNNDIVNGPFAVKLGADGKFKVYTFSTTHLVIDISGYYSTSPTDANGLGLLFNPLPKPMRLLETRPDFPGFPLTGCYRPNAPILGGTDGIRTQPVWGTCSDQPITIPNAARAVVGNVTAINPTGAGFGTFFPGNVGTAPTVATTNYPFPVIFGYNRHYYVGLSPSDGTFKILTQFTSDYIVDVSGYFAP